MFTIKLTGHCGKADKILSADTLSVYRTPTGAEITLHQVDSLLDSRVEVGPDEEGAVGQTKYLRAIIENPQGSTTEIIHARPKPRDMFANAPAPLSGGA